jgi:paired amphipathic helix protein Sin3a
MDDSQGPSGVLEQILRDRGVGAEDSGEALYQYLLEACEKLFMNELDQATFEEHMRWFFGTKVGETFSFSLPSQPLTFCFKGVLALHGR